jgi:biotin-dependent carboxylase-like uncharacterized protein
MIHVQSPGMFTTVQDLGRYGYGPLGVSPSGAADPVSLRIGNLLVGNLPNAAALEMTLLGGTFAFPEGATIVLTGSDFGVDTYRVHEIAPGGVLKLGPTRSGARCYLCVAGGIEVAPLLGSASTHILSGLGGFDGRALRKGDQLKIGAHEKPASRSIHSDTLKKLAPRKTIRTTIAPQSDWFTADSLTRFYSGVYSVTEESNRMGLRLEGAALDPPHDGHMTSEGVSLGAIQVPSKGQPIILFVEQQTTGGYPKIANVISADLASVGQLRPRDEIRFELVTPEIALDLIREQEDLLASCISI